MRTFYETLALAMQERVNTTYRRYVKPQFSDMQKSMVSIDAIVR